MAKLAPVVDEGKGPAGEATQAPPTRRRYDASGSAPQLVPRTRRILASARELFVEGGYANTTVTAIARHAGVSPDTVYASVGTKPTLFRELVEVALSGIDRPVEGAARDYAVRMRAEPDAAAKLGIYARAVTELQGRLAPLFLVFREAAPGRPSSTSCGGRSPIDGPATCAASPPTSPQGAPCAPTSPSTRWPT